MENDNSNAIQLYKNQLFSAAANGDTKKIIEIFRLASAKQISPDERDERGYTPLMLAARNGHLEATEQLLKIGADARMVNKSGQSALDIASFWSHQPVVNALKGFLIPKMASQLELVNYFSHSIVDRQSYKRSDSKHLDEEMKSDRSRFMVFGELELLMKNVEGRKETVYLTWDDVKANLGGDREHDLVFLGVGNIEKGVLMREGVVLSDDEKLVYFSINYKKIPAEEDLPRKGGFFGGKAYTGLMGLRNADSGIASQARSVLAWHDSYVYCPSCGSTTEMADAGWKRVCRSDACRTHKGAHNASFPRTDPVVIILILSKDKNRCLLGRQGRHPPRMYSAIAGFVESGENIEDAARREAMEEVGVKIGKIEYHSSQPWPFPCSLMIGLIGHAIDDEFKCDKVELDDARWFDKNEVAAAYVEGFNRSEGLLIPPPFAIANQLIKAWLQMSSLL